MKIQELRTLYTKYGKIQLGNIESLYGKADDCVKLKLKHGISMSESVPRITSMSGLFHKSFERTAAIDGLFHDIGRFSQYLLIGSLSDADLEKLYKIKDHGRLGAMLLEDVDIKNFFSLGDYVNILKPVIGNHTEIYVPRYHINLSEMPPIFLEYTFEEVLKRPQFLDYLIAAKIKAVTEADNFELLENIVNKDWTPKISSELEDYATDEVWQKFADNKPIMIAEMKKQNAWTTNSGVLLRYGLLPQKAQLRSTLELLLEKDYLKKLMENALQYSSDPKIIEGYVYATLLTQNIINLNGPIITTEQREKAVQKTKKMWK